MESEKITNLEILTEITCKIEAELNRVKDWIKTQMSDADTNGYKNKCQTAAVAADKSQNLTNLKNYDENGPIFSVTEQMPLIKRLRPVIISTTSLANSTKTDNTIIKMESQETNESDDDIEIIEDTRNYEPALIIPHLIENDNEEISTSQNFRNSKSFKTEEIDPLATTTDTTINSEKDTDQVNTAVVTTSTGTRYKIKMMKKVDFLNRNKSVQILKKATRTSWKKHKNNMIKVPPASYKCQVCSKEFNSPVKYKNHLEIHSTTRSYACQFCSKSFKTYNCMNSHTGRVHRDERKDFEFKCDECDLNFKKESALENHKTEAHIGIKCKFCRNVFYSRFNLFQHVQNTHLICGTPSCEKQFSTQDALKLHRRENHPSNRMNQQNLHKS